MTRRFGLVWVAIGVASSGCASDTTAPTGPEAAVPTAIVLSHTSLAFSTLRATRSLTATVLDQRDGTMTGVTLSWSSSDSSVATVDPSGVVTAVGNGAGSITVRAGAATATAAVVVEQVAAALVLDRDTVRLAALGDTATLTAAVSDAAGHLIEDAEVRWSSSDTAVARVSDAGVVMSVRNGAAHVTATSGSLSTSAIVTIAQVAASVVLSRDTIRFTALGDTAVLTAAVLDARGSPLADQAVTWVAGDSAVARVTGGHVTARANGTAAVSARSGSAMGTASVIVRQHAASLQIPGGAQRSLALTDTLTLAAIARDANGWVVPDAIVGWTSSDTTVARMSASGVATALHRGTATITASVVGAPLTAMLALTVVPVKIESIPASLATPAPGALWEIPVVIIRYIPTLDDVTVDAGEAAISGTLGAIRRRIEVFEERVKFMLEEGSRFRGYRDASAPYALGYRVVHIVTVFGHFQRGREVPWNPGHYFPDYHQILGQVDARKWVNEHGVKEFWIWGYHSNQFEQPESNMSSPFTGDISNSSRFADDLPVFDHTYTVYGYNFARSQAEAVHNHGHQLEAILGHVDHSVFWREYVGRNATNTQFVTGRAGWTHSPPNTTQEYDYLNATAVPSDIADWKPGGGQTTPVSASTWGGVQYDWPASRLVGESQIQQRTESQWYIYWMQSMPGRDNTIPHGSGFMTNWWRFTGDWDGAIRDGYRLSTAPGSVTIRNDFVGAITLSPGGLLAAGQSVVLATTVPLLVRVWDCGEPGAGGCIFDPYLLTPGKSYRVIQHPEGPVNNLTIVEQ